MSDKSFVDTNILIYLYSVDQPTKQVIAQKLVTQHNIIISTQVIQEFTNTLRKKHKTAWADIHAAIAELMATFTISVNTTDTINKALTVAEKYNYSFYDSMIIAAALENKCAILYSEDLQHKQLIFGKLQIINPFIG